MVMKEKEKLIKMCFAFYNAGVRDGDTGQLDKFNLAGEYDNNYCVFKQYFLAKKFDEAPIEFNKIKVWGDKLWDDHWDAVNSGEWCFVDKIRKQCLAGIMRRVKQGLEAQGVAVDKEKVWAVLRDLVEANEL